MWIAWCFFFFFLLFLLSLLLPTFTKIYNVWANLPKRLFCTGHTHYTPQTTAKQFDSAIVFDKV